MSSSGTAVVFSGATVAVSLAALFAIDVNALRSMAVGAIVVVCISVLASITLLPALLAAVGHARRPAADAAPVADERGGSDAFWSGWARRVMRRPVAGFAAGAGIHARARDPVLLDADVQPRARRAAEDGGGARGDRAGAGARRARASALPCTCSPRTTHVRAAARGASLASHASLRRSRAADGRQWLIDVTLGVPVESSGGARRRASHRGASPARTPSSAAAPSSTST